MNSMYRNTVCNEKKPLMSSPPQVPRGMPKQGESLSSRCLWTWIQTATRSSTLTSPVPPTQRTSVLSSPPSKTPSCSSTWRSTTWCRARRGRRQEALDTHWLTQSVKRYIIYTHTHEKKIREKKKSNGCIILIYLLFVDLLVPEGWAK